MPGKPPPLLRHPHEAASDVHRDVVKASTTIAEVHHDVMNTQAMVCKILKSQEEVGGQDRSASITCTLPVTKKTLTIAQAQGQ